MSPTTSCTSNQNTSASDAGRAHSTAPAAKTPKGMAATTASSAKGTKACKAAWSPPTKAKANCPRRTSKCRCWKTCNGEVPRGSSLGRMQMVFPGPCSRGGGGRGCFSGVRACPKGGCCSCCCCCRCCCCCCGCGSSVAGSSPTIGNSPDIGSGGVSPCDGGGSPEAAVAAAEQGGAGSQIVPSGDASTGGDWPEDARPSMASTC
mmetsp:Transcript_80849/g.261183  ORF Transcript_80849/g.261183 Transcript_80849/m.261183 type:complete len:205 (-) Transcript_80849:1125-1739(-)